MMMSFLFVLLILQALLTFQIKVHHALTKDF
jgi:hypothetical protein